ncbi:MAG: hypothetical protein K8I01_08735 [Candidatus Methylomirabilis sp.]|nr:hypothetical protein [Deltaproteobacteria bacterium]
MEEAFKSYNRARTPVCSAKNPVENEAAARLAPIALKLGKAAEKNGEIKRAFEFYEAGGHFAAADHMMLAIARAAGVNERDKVERAMSHFDGRRSGDFKIERKPALAAAGEYELDTSMYDEVMNLPAANGKKALEAESKALDEDYLGEYQAVLNARPKVPTLDEDVLKEGQASEKAFRRKWKTDRIEESLKLLSEAHSWFVVAPPDARKEAISELGKRRIMRGELITERYHGAPGLLEKAAQYFRAAGDEKRIKEVRTKAKVLGDQAMQKGHFLDAKDYYKLAEDSAGEAKADAGIKEAEERQAAKAAGAGASQIEELKRFYGDPEKAKEMQRSAEEMQKRMLKDSRQRKQFQQEQDDLERELGL